MFVHNYYAFAGVKPKLNTGVYDTGGAIGRRVKNAVSSYSSFNSTVYQLIFTPTSIERKFILCTLLYLNNAPPDE